MRNTFAFISFIIYKTKVLDHVRNKLNTRQEGCTNILQAMLRDLELRLAKSSLIMSQDFLTQFKQCSVSQLFAVM
ncbi:MAG: hypothetical protein P1U40_02640 [Coxiellaceae bacterium]|nr:hypothetical protein [Coxiellaceae bacterium]